MPRLTEKDLQSIEQLNRTLWAYLEIEYHRTPHRMLGETPLDRWARVGQRVRYPEPGVDVDDLFLFESKRKVQKDCTVSLNGMVYEIHASLVGETVTLRYNPVDQGDLIEVCHNGQFVQEAKLVDAYANCFVKRDRPSRSIQEIATEAQDSKKGTPAKPAHPMNFTKITGSGSEEGTNV